MHSHDVRNGADIFFKVPPNFRIPRHWHTSAERVALVSAELHVTYEGEPTTVLKPGMYVYDPAKLAHEAVAQAVRIAFCSSHSRRPWMQSLLKP